MLKKIIIVEDDKKIQCDSEEEIIKLLIDDKYYELSDEEKIKRREIKAIANCINNDMEIVKDIDVKTENIEGKFIIKDEKTYVLSLLRTNNIMLLERIDSNIYTGNINKKDITDNYIIVNKFANRLLEIYLRKK